MTYYSYKPTLERKKELLFILEELKKDYEKVSFYSQHAIQLVIQEVENELKNYQKRIFNFETGDPNIFYHMHYEDYTDEELSHPDKLLEDRARQLDELISAQHYYQMKKYSKEKFNKK